MVLSYEKPKRAQIVYFSGTGGTKMAASALADALAGREISCELFPLNGKSSFVAESGALLIVMFPVYAFNAPAVIDDFLEALAFSAGGVAAVIAVSGGGEVSPNTASRCRTTRHLKKKGFQTVYEAGLVMPSNLIMEYPEVISLAILRILPEKAEEIAADLSSGRVKRMKIHVFDRFLARLGVLERCGSPDFGKKMKVSDACKGCGLCAAKCSRGNIALENGRPVFKDRCIMCLGCIYRCPQKALTPGILKSFVLVGYDLNLLQRKLDEDSPKRLDREEIKTLTKGYLMSGVRKYLLEK